MKHAVALVAALGSCLFATSAAFAALSVSTDHLVLGDTPSMSVSHDFYVWQGFMEGATADATFDPAVEGLLYTAEIDGGIFYKVVVPAGGLSPTTDGWALNDAGRAASGLEELSVTRVRNSPLYSLKLTDSGLNLPSRDYSGICVTLAIGDDSGTSCSSLIQTGSVWQIN